MFHPSQISVFDIFLLHHLAGLNLRVWVKPSPMKMMWLGWRTNWGSRSHLKSFSMEFKVIRTKLLSEYWIHRVLEDLVERSSRIYGTRLPQLIVKFSKYDIKTSYPLTLFLDTWAQQIIPIAKSTIWTISTKHINWYSVVNPSSLRRLFCVSR